MTAVVGRGTSIHPLTMTAETETGIVIETVPNIRRVETIVIATETETAIKIETGEGSMTVAAALGRGTAMLEETLLPLAVAVPPLVNPQPRPTPMANPTAEELLAAVAPLLL